MNEDRKNICIYGASSSRINESYRSDAFRIGELIALSGYGLICGGGRAGLMAAAIEGANSQGGHTIGVLPEFMIEKSWEHRELSEIIITPDMHTRKRTMAEKSMAVIALPGGCGTMEELLEIITWRQLGLYNGNIVILNTDSYYEPLRLMLERSVERGFMHPDNQKLWSIADCPEKAVEQSLNPNQYNRFTDKI